jgi:hypothetical protein
MAHTITIVLPSVTSLRDRELERIDQAVDLIRTVNGVIVHGWGDDDD